MDRFSKVTMSIRNLSPDVAMHHMLTTLRPGPFADNLCMQPADSLDKLRKRATKYMQLEELREFRNQARAEAGGERKEEKDRQARRENRDRPIWFSRYTPLTTERGRILDEALRAELILPPRKVANPNNADWRKQCRYHQNAGHSTEECQALKDKIEELIQAGHLRRFMRNGRDPPRWADPPRRTRSPHRSRNDQDNRGDRQLARDDPPEGTTPHLAMKFPSRTGDILTVHVDQKEARECYVESLQVEPLRAHTSPLRVRKSSRKDRSPRKDRPREIKPCLLYTSPSPRD